MRVGAGVHRDNSLYAKIDWNKELVLKAEALVYDNIWVPDHLELEREWSDF